jgi:hypothetical protein
VIRLSHISSLGFVVAVTFILLLLSFRLTLPFGDEPDFTVRAIELTEIAWPAWSLYSWVPGLLESLETSSECVIEATPLSLVAHIDHASCTQNLDQVLLRCVLTLLVMCPLMLLIVWRGLGMMILKKTVTASLTELRARLDAIALSLLIPGMIYYVSVLSHEQFTLVISLFIFLFWGNLAVVFTLIALVASIDMGNAAVIACFVVVHQITSIATKQLAAKVTLVIGLGFLALVSYIGNELISYVGVIPLLEDRSNAIYGAVTTDDENLRNKFPVALRPVITFMTFFLSTPAGIKVIPIYVLVCVYLVVGALRLRHRYKMTKLHADELNSYWLVLGVSALYTMVLFIFLVPGYANGKYYVFLLPFIVKLALQVFSNWSIYRFLTCSSVLIPLAMVLFRIS